MTSKAPELEYLAGLRRLLGEEASFDPVKQVIRARLAGAREPVQGRVVPPLGRDDPDTSLLLLYLYDQLRFDQDEPAKERLRRAVVELLEEALNSGAGFQAIDCLGQLVGAFEVRRSDLLAGRLRTWLWGHLEIGLLRPGEALIELTGDDLIHARQILDLWMAVTPPSKWPEGPTPRPSDFPSVHPAVPRAPEARPGICRFPVPDPVPVGPREPRAGCQGDLAGPVL